MTFYHFVVAAIFKNEEHALIEWIEHYKFHGAQHIYLIDDNSNDNGVQIIQPYIENGFVTLFNANFPMYLGRQKDIYNTFILPLIHNKISKWTFICDLDEFLWSPDSLDIKDLLFGCKHFSQIQINHSQFGSSGYIDQPKCIVKYFIYKEKEETELLKYFVNSDFKFSSLNIHHATYVNKEDSINTFIRLSNFFKLNHYIIQSLNFWNNIKCTRGDADSYLLRDESQFHGMDKNEVEDLSLWEQNKNMDFYKDI